MSTITTPSPKTPASLSTEGVVPSYVLQLSEVESRIGEKNNKVEIGSQPVMIGSGPRCTLRVDTPGTKPVHCVVSLGEEGPVVRRWATETLLNGEPFTEALLAEGDRLSIGTVDVEIRRLDEVDQPLAQELASQESVSVDSSEDFDPAVPQHLLTPWTADKSEDKAAENEEPENEEVAEEAPESITDPVEESACESLSDISDWIGGESEWTVADEAAGTATEEAASKEETSEEESRVVADHDELAADPWAIELAPVDELIESTQAEPEESFGPLLSEEVNAWVTDSVSEELVPSSEAESDESDPIAEPVVDVETDESAVADVEEAPVETDNVAAIALLQNRLSMRADRLRSVISTLRDERVEREQQEIVAVETVALVEQLQADLARVKQQAGDDAASLADLQKELSAANELIETLEASLHAAIESTSGVAYQEALEPREPVAEAVVDVEEEPVVEEEQSLWPDASDEVSQDVVSLEEATISPEESLETEPGAETPEPEILDAEGVVESPVVSEDLWGIEHLAAETPVEESIVDEEPSVETAEETLLEAPVEVPVEVHVEAYIEGELTGSLDDVLLPGETAEELSTEPEAVSEVEDDSPVVEVIDDGNSVLASLMTRPSHETEGQAEAPAEAESFIDRYAHILPEDETEEFPIDSVETALSESMELEPALSETQGSEEGEESLDDYMKKMMGRIRGDEAPAEVAPKASRPVIVKATSVAPVAVETATPEPKQAPIQNLDELKRNPTRELGADLGELRQLANQSARRAIDVSETNDKKEHAAMRLTIAGIGATCGLLACMTAPSVIDWQFYAGLVGVVGGSYLGLRTVKVIQHSAALKAAVENEVTAPAI